MNSIESEVLPYVTIENAPIDSKCVEALMFGIPMTILVNNGKVVRGGDIVKSYLAFMENELQLEGILFPEFKSFKKKDLKLEWVRRIKLKPVFFIYLNVSDELIDLFY